MVHNKTDQTGQICNERKEWTTLTVNGNIDGKQPVRHKPFVMWVIVCVEERVELRLESSILIVKSCHVILLVRTQLFAPAVG